MKVRKVSNKGNPLRSPDGKLLSGVRVTYKLIDAELKPTDVWDAINNERIMPLLIYTETGTNGQFEVNLWPNDRGEKPTYYECYVSVPGAGRFICYLTDGDTEIDWLTLRVTDLMTPLASSLLQLHMQNTSVHLSVADRAKLDALGNMTAPFYYVVDIGTTNNIVLPYTVPLPQHTLGMPILFRSATTNTGACSVNINSLEPMFIKGPENNDLAPGQILANKIYQLVYDGAVYQLLNPYITSIVDNLYIFDTFDALSEAEMLALDAQKGDSCRRLDLSKTFVLRTNDPTNITSWAEILAAPDTNYGGF